MDVADSFYRDLAADSRKRTGSKVVLRSEVSSVYQNTDGVDYWKKKLKHRSQKLKEKPDLGRLAHVPRKMMAFRDDEWNAKPAPVSIFKEHPPKPIFSSSKPVFVYKIKTWTEYSTDMTASKLLEIESKLPEKEPEWVEPVKQSIPVKSLQAKPTATPPSKPDFRMKKARPSTADLRRKRPQSFANEFSTTETTNRTIDSLKSGQRLESSCYTSSQTRVDWFAVKESDVKLELKEAIGKGSFGTVYRAYDRLLEVEVAVKHFDKRYVKDSSARKSIQNEIDILGRLDHPAVVKLLRIAQSVNDLYIVMEYWGKKNLSQLIDKNFYTLGTYKDIMKSLMDGLIYLHENNVYHRDIKCENAMVKVDDQGHYRACFIDFGLASECKPGDYLNSASGTICCMAPELHMSALYLPGPNDVWALGVLFYVMLTKEFPFGSKLV